MERTPTDTAVWVAPMNPGGGAWSTVHDLSQVLLMELAKGKTPDGKQVITEPNLLARREPQARGGEKYSYGLALDVETYRDVRVYGHGGALSGYTSYMFFLPDHGVAAVMLTNVGFPNSFVHGQFRRKLFELLFEIDFASNRSFFDRFVGAYEHPLYGKMTIRVDPKKGAVLDVGEWTSALAKKTEEDGTEKLVTTTAPWIGWPEFVPKERDGKMTLELQDGQRKVVFERVSGGK
jgi:CubicO group peptidase (beta-lactamase class C family)